MGKIFFYGLILAFQSFFSIGHNNIETYGLVWYIIMVWNIIMVGFIIMVWYIIMVDVLSWFDVLLWFDISSWYMILSKECLAGSVEEGCCPVLWRRQSPSRRTWSPPWTHRCGTLYIQEEMFRSDKIVDYRGK